MSGLDSCVLCGAVCLCLKPSLLARGVEGGVVTGEPRDDGGVPLLSDDDMNSGCEHTKWTVCVVCSSSY